MIFALTNGRVCVTTNPYAPRVEFYADLDQDGKMDMMMGDNVRATGKAPFVEFTYTPATPGRTYYRVEVQDGLFARLLFF